MIEDKGIEVISVACTSGCHRADTIGRTVETALNSLVDARGERRFNAMLLATCSCKNDSDAESTVKFLKMWVREPWDIMEPGANTKSYKTWTRTRPDSCKHFQCVMDFIDEINANAAPLEPVDEVPEDACLAQGNDDQAPPSRR